MSYSDDNKRVSISISNDLAAALDNYATTYSMSRNQAVAHFINKGLINESENDQLTSTLITSRNEQLTMSDIRRIVKVLNNPKDIRMFRVQMRTLFAANDNNRQFYNDHKDEINTILA